MLQKIVDKLNSINSFSKSIIKWGSIFSLALCLMGLGIIEYNSLTQNLVDTYTIGSTLVYTSIVAFAQFVVGSLIMDFLGTVISNGN